MSNPNWRFQTLGDALADLERTDPKVRAVVEKQDREARRRSLGLPMRDRRPPAPSGSKGS